MRGQECVKAGGDGGRACGSGDNGPGFKGQPCSLGLGARD